MVPPDFRRPSFCRKSLSRAIDRIYTRLIQLIGLYTPHVKYLKGNSMLRLLWTLIKIVIYLAVIVGFVAFVDVLINFSVRYF